MVQRLLSSGHLWSDIQDYTIAQINLFLREVKALGAEEASTRTTLTRAAVWADGEDLNKLLADLTGHD